MPSYDLRITLERYPEEKGCSWGCPDLNLMGYGNNELKNLFIDIENSLNKMMGKDTNLVENEPNNSQENKPHKGDASDGTISGVQSESSPDTRKGCGKIFDYVSKEFGLLRLQCGVWQRMKVPGLHEKMEYCKECQESLKNVTGENDG